MTLAWRCLVADDEPDNADLLAALLEQRGHSVEVVHDGKSALRTLEAKPDIAVIFLDIGLPGMDGFEVAKVVRERFGNAIRIVAVTGFGTEEYRERAHGAGCNAVLVKPFPLEAIDELMKAFMAGS